MTSPLSHDQHRRILHQRLDTHGDDLSRLDASSLSAGYALKLWTPTRVVEAFLRRIAARNEALHAYVDVWADDALKAARAATLLFGGFPIDFPLDLRIGPDAAKS